jgi:hypothetical protein
MPKTKKNKPIRHRVYKSYYDYIDNVVTKCGHKYLIMDNVKFRDYRIEAANNPNVKKFAGVALKVHPAKCKSYSCPYCGSKKVYDLVDRLKQVNLAKYRFFTLTLKNKKDNLDNTLENLDRVASCFNKLNNKLRKDPRYKGLEYFRVTEIAAGGMVHIHGIWNKYIPSHELCKIWQQITKDSYIVKVERIKNKADAIRYLYKYLTKDVAKKDYQIDPALFNMDLQNSAAMFYELGKRRFAASRNFFPKGGKKVSEFVPYWFEAYPEKDIEQTLYNLVKTYNLTKDQIDLNQYYSSDLFLEELFKPKDPPVARSGIDHETII